MKTAYTESVVANLPRPGDRILQVLLAVALVATVLMVFVAGWAWLIPAGVLGWLLWRQNQRLSSEYDYVHTNDIFDVDMVIRGSKRKHLTSVDLNHVLLIAPEGSEEAEAFSHLKAADYTGNAQENRYAMVWAQNGKKGMLLLRLEPELHRSLKLWIPGKVR